MYRQRNGMAKKPTDRPVPIKPVPEKYKGVNFPYRGIEMHGVDVPEGTEYDTREFQYPEDDGKAEILPAPIEPDPIPVKVVTETARERLDWRAARFSVNTRAQQVLGRHDKRKAVRIRNHSETEAIYIGNDAGMQAYTGFMIPPGEELYPFHSTEDVWACTDSDAAESVEISIMYEFAVAL